MKREIQVPKPVSVKAADGTTTTITFAQFVGGHTCDETFTDDGVFSMKDVLAAVRVSTAAELSGLLGPMTLNEEDWKRLVRVVEKPKLGYNPIVAKQLSQFMLAVLNATVIDDSPKNPT